MAKQIVNRTNGVSRIDKKAAEATEWANALETVKKLFASPGSGKRSGKIKNAQARPQKSKLVL